MDAYQRSRKQVISFRIRLVLIVQVASIMVMAAFIITNIWLPRTAHRREIVSLSFIVLPPCLLAMNLCPIAFVALLISSRFLSRRERWTAVAIEVILIWFQWEWLIRPCTNI